MRSTLPSSSSPPSAPRRLLTPERVRELLTATDPEYGRAFTEAQWSEIAERLSALARLIWRISERRAAEEAAPRSREPAAIPGSPTRLAEAPRRPRR